jgi:hypothetical protein
MRRLAALVASALMIATGLIYWGFLIRQAGQEGVLAALNPNTTIFSAVIVVITGLAAYGALGRDPRLRAVALWAAVPGLVVFGVLAGFSIGVLLLIAAVPASIAAVSALGDPGVRRTVALGAAALAALAWLGVGALLLWLPTVT